MEITGIVEIVTENRSQDGMCNMVTLCKHIHMSTDMCIFIHACTHTYRRTHGYLYIYASTHVYVYTYVYTHMCVFTPMICTICKVGTKELRLVVCVMGMLGFHCFKNFFSCL